MGQRFKSVIILHHEIEPVMWRGGEAEASRDKAKAMSATERDALVKFLESL